VSDRVTLTLRSPLESEIDGSSIVPLAFARLGESEIAALPVWAGRHQRPLGDYFDVTGERSASVRVVGDVRRARWVGSGMGGGELVIDGSAGSHLCAGLAGGRADVLGSVGDDAGLGMTGGSLRIRGSAGNRLGAAMPGASRGVTGGEIVVEGSVGSDAGARMRRGLLFVAGSAGDRAGRAMIAGTVFVMGRTGREPALANKRGSLIVAGGVDVPVTYRYACEYAPPHVRVALTSLARRYGLSIDRRFVEGQYRRYCGDAGTVAKGEILEWIGE
jgi:formylmethanofuran dehydrogenase subunit C